MSRNCDLSFGSRKRTLTGREAVAHVADALAYVVPDVRHFAGRRAALQVDEYGRAAWAGEAAQKIEVRGFLEGLLDAVRHLIECLLEGGAGPAGLHDHGAEGECRILVAAEAGIEQRARDQEHEHAIHDKGAMPQRPFREIESSHRADSRSRVFWPGCSA